MEQVDGEHLVLVVIAEDVGVIAFYGGDALLLLKLIDGRDQVATLGGALELLVIRGLRHALAERLHQVGLSAFQEKLHVADGFLIGLGSGEVLHARAETALDVELQTRPRMGARQVDLAGRNQEVAVDQVDDAIGEVGREVWTVVGAAILPQASSDVDAREALGEREFHVGIRLVVAQQDVEARLLLLDEMVLEGEGFLIIGDDDVVDIDRLTDERAGLRIFPSSLVEVGRDAGAQVLRLADIDDFAFGVLVEVHAGGSGDSTDFGGKIHDGLMSSLAVSERDAVSCCVVRRILV